jgi:hypothetical protein
MFQKHAISAICTLDERQNMAASVKLKKKISGRESQGARPQDELIGGKPPVVTLL